MTYPFKANCPIRQSNSSSTSPAMSSNGTSSHLRHPPGFTPSRARQGSTQQCKQSSSPPATPNHTFFHPPTPELPPPNHDKPSNHLNTGNANAQSKHMIANHFASIARQNHGNANNHSKRKRDVPGASLLQVSQPLYGYDSLGDLQKMKYFNSAGIGAGTARAAGNFAEAEIDTSSCLGVENPRLPPDTRTAKNPKPSLQSPTIVLKEKVAALTEENAALTEEGARLRETNDKLQKGQNIIGQRNVDLQQQLQEMKQKYECLEKDVKNLADTNTEQKQATKLLAQQLAKSEEEKNALNDRLDKTEKTIEQKAEANQVFKQTIATLEGEKNELVASLKRANATINQLECERNQLELDAEVLADAKKLLEQQLVSSEKEKTDFEFRLSSLVVSNQQVRSERDECKIAAKSLATENEHLNQIILSLEGEKEQLQSEKHGFQLEITSLANANQVALAESAHKYEEMIKQLRCERDGFKSRAECCEATNDLYKHQNASLEQQKRDLSARANRFEKKVMDSEVTNKLLEGAVDTLKVNVDSVQSERNRFEMEVNVYSKANELLERNIKALKDENEALKEENAALVDKMKSTRIDGKAEHEVTSPGRPSVHSTFCAEDGTSDHPITLDSDYDTDKENHVANDADAQVEPAKKKKVSRALKSLATHNHSPKKYGLRSRRSNR